MTSPFLTSAEAAIYLRFVREDGSPDVQQVMQYVRKLKVPYRRRAGGRGRVLIHQDDLKDSAPLVSGQSLETVDTRRVR